MLALCESCHCVVAVYHIVHNFGGGKLGCLAKLTSFTNILLSQIPDSLK